MTVGVGEKLNRNKQGCARGSVTKTPDSHRKKNNVNYQQNKENHLTSIKSWWKYSVHNDAFQRFGEKNSKFNCSLEVIINDQGY